jgi:hypothetical protein
VGFTWDVTSNRALRVAVQEVQTNRAGQVAVDADILFLNGTTLAEKLLEYGLAAALPATPQNQVDYAALQRDAQREERGLWEHPLPVDRRFSVASDYEVQTLNIDRDSVRAEGGQGSRRLESSRVSQKQAVIDIDIAVRKPMWHSYRGVVRYAFHTREEEGRRVQQITPTPLPSSSDDSNRRASSAERNRYRDEVKQVEEYNRQADGGAVSKMGRTEDMTMPFELSSLSTTLVVKSAIEDYTSTTKAGVSYNQGTTFRGYDVEVLIGTNVVYRHYHEHRGFD